MKKDIDNMLEEMLAPKLEKKQAEIIARARRRILKEAKLPASKRKRLVSQSTEAQKAAMEKEEETTYKSEVVISLHEPLRKNEYEFNLSEAGDLRMEFGPEVPESFKKRAMDWAKRKGLKVTEMSLGKSQDSFTWVVFK